MKALRVDPADNVAVVIQPTQAGNVLHAGALCIEAVEDIMIGHKIALSNIKEGAFIVKYGVPIGKALQDIAAGSHVHTHNTQDVTEELCCRNAIQTDSSEE